MDHHRFSFAASSAQLWSFSAWDLTTLLVLGVEAYAAAPIPRADVAAKVTKLGPSWVEATVQVAAALLRVAAE